MIMMCFSALLACGGGGSGGGGGASPTKSVSGIAAAGPISGGTVTIYSIKTDGSKGDTLGTATTGQDGSYSVNIGSYTGDVLVELSGGTYTDEATGGNLTNGLLHAALMGVSGNVSVAVTPLTEIAWQLVSPTLNIDQANSLVGDMVGLNIINTLPTDVTKSGSVSGATADQVNYGLMLATISQYINDGKAADLSAAINNIKSDLADNNKLDAVGNDMLTDLSKFISGANNKSGVTSSNQTNLTNAITFITQNAVTPPTDTADLQKAKDLVADLRNTVLSIHNDQSGISGILDTPFVNLAGELNNTIQPELTMTVDRIAWIVNSVSQVNLKGSWPQVFTHDTYTLTITTTDGETYTFLVTAGTTGIDSGSVVINDPNLPTSGTFTATMQTINGHNLSANFNYSATKATSGNYYTSINFNGTLIDNAIGLSLSINSLTANFALEPNTTDVMYPTSASLSATITSQTARMTGVLTISPIVWNATSQVQLPRAATFTGTAEEMYNGSPTGVKFTGTIDGTWNNADTYNINIDPSGTNYPNWNASFNGKIEAPLRPTLETFLKVTEGSYNQFALDVSYKRTNPDGTIVSLTGSGTMNATTQIITGQLTNQINMNVSLSFDGAKDGDQKFTGSISTTGNAKMADLYTINGIPMVKYIDNYIESII
jgi:hypothetical protein